MYAKRSFIAVAALGAILIIGLNAFHASAWGVTIDTNLSVSPNVISFATVFPQETLFRPLRIGLSKKFLASSILDDVEYRILQKTKPRIDSSAKRAYCASNPNDLSRCYPSLCPYLSKEPDNAPNNDTGVLAFHNPSATSSIALGRLAKSDSDTEDTWNIDLHVPCFRDQCAQDWASFVRNTNPNANPDDYVLNPSLQHETFGCDFVVEVVNVSYAQSVTRTQGFWQTKTQFTSSTFSIKLGGVMTVGTGAHQRTITNQSGQKKSILFGAFYSSTSKKTTGQARSALDKARIRLLRQLVTAKLNCAVFGCSSSVQTLITNADAAYAGTSTGTMGAAASNLAAYNESGEALPIPPSLPPRGSATPSLSQSLANKLFWDTP